jgi:hypothetical protein
VACVMTIFGSAFMGVVPFSLVSGQPGSLPDLANGSLEASDRALQQSAGG